jgi:Zn-dependent protease with chaperone function
METTPIALLYLTILAWVSVGLGILAAYRRAGTRTLLRLTAVFLGFWAVFATTGLVWVVLSGGYPGLLALARSPALLFQLRFAWLWLAGGLGAFGVFAVAFLLNQSVGRGFLALLRPRSLGWPSRLPRPRAPTTLLAFPSPHLEAFSFTLLERGGARGVRRRDVILLSDGLLDALTDAEVEAVVAHELGHLRELDGRYLTFFRVLSRMMRWDPVLALLSERLTAVEERRADLDAVEVTRRPRALARALFKATRASPAPTVGAALLGVGGPRGRRQAEERIRVLVALAESGRFPEEPVA